MNWINQIKSFRHKAYIWMFCHMPIQQNKIIFWADSFKHFGCSPKYIALYLLEHYPRKFDLVWVFEDGAFIPADLPEEIRIVKYFSIDYLRELHTAKFVICNMRTGDAQYWHKRQDQIYIQTWHSSLRLKKIEGDALSGLGSDYADFARKDSEKIDLLLSGCAFSTDIFERAFWYDGVILKGGTPRCDILVQHSDTIRKKVFRFYGIPENHKLLLYAPTFRADKKANTMGMDFAALGEALKKRGDGEWTLGCRLHPNILEDTQAKNCVIMSKYSDMQELLCAADMLITDYSSCMFDMAIADKPCVLFVPDLIQYTSNERGLYFDIEELPFPIAQDMGALCDTLIRFDETSYQKNLHCFMDQIGSYEDGKAAERVVQYICERIGR